MENFMMCIDTTLLLIIIAPVIAGAFYFWRKKYE